MSLISSLFGGRGGKKRAIGDVEESLSRVAAERETARAAISATLRKRDDLLLTGSDADIQALDAELDRWRLTLERVDRAEPLLLAELTGLRTDAKAALWADLRARYDAAIVDYIKAMRVALERQAALLNLNDEARRRGFEHEVQASFTPPTRMLSVDALHDFEIAAERQREAGKPRPAAAPAPKPATAPKQQPKAIPASKPAAPSKQAPKPASKPPLEAKADEAGNIQIHVLRPGLEVGGRSRASGEVISLPFADARRVVESGGADFADAL